MKPVGLLWDSVSNNIGDQAIGLVLKQFCSSNNLPYSQVDPFHYDIEDYSTIIIGGGELIRSKGNPFYDSYRVPGRQILNAVGAHNPSDLQYLADYRKITARSKADRDRIINLVPSLNVDIVPCTTILAREFFPGTIDPSSIKPGERVGVHINTAALNNLPEFVVELKRLNSYYPIELIPFTLYQNDISLLTMISKYLPDATVYADTDPFQVLAEIGRMKLMITSSLHAAIFSYINEIPFLAYPVYPKIAGFLEERGLDSYLFTSSRYLTEKVHQAISAPLDYHQALIDDKQVVSHHLSEVKQIIESISAESENSPQFAYSYQSDRRLHSSEMDLITVSSQLSVERLDFQLDKQRLLDEMNTYKNEISTLKDEIATFYLSTSWRITRPFRKVMRFIKERLGG